MPVPTVLNQSIYYFFVIVISHNGAVIVCKKLSIIVCFCNFLKKGRLSKKPWIAVFLDTFWGLLRYFLCWNKEMGRLFFRVFSKTTRKKANKWLLYLKFSQKKSPNMMGNEHVWLHNSVLLFYGRREINISYIHEIWILVENGFHGEGEINWGLPALCCPRATLRTKKATPQAPNPINWKPQPQRPNLRPPTP